MLAHSRRTSLYPLLSLLSVLVFDCTAEHTLLENFLQSGTGVKLISFDQNEDLGYSVAIDGDVALVSASGGAYVYRRCGGAWKKEANLITVKQLGLADSYDCRFGDEGYVVALHNHVAIIGDPLHRYEPDLNQRENPTYTGAAYVYRFDGSTWQKEATLSGNAAIRWNEFGYAVSFDGRTIAVGDPEAGVVYLYQHDGAQWKECAALTPANVASSDEYGAAVSIRGDILVVGASSKNERAYNSGAAFIYRLHGLTWVEEACLFVDDVAEQARFGAAVAVDENVVAIGAPNDAFGSATGSVHVFRFDGANWYREVKLLFTSANYTYFGRAVALAENTLVVGMPNYKSGTAIVYEWTGDTWHQQQQLVAHDDPYHPNFGWCIDMDGQSIIVGAPCRDDGDSYDHHYESNSVTSRYDYYRGTAFVYARDER